MKRVILLVIMAVGLSGCSHHTQVESKPACPEFDPLVNENEEIPCVVVPDEDGNGNSVECRGFDLPPAEWGKCVEAKDRSFACESDGNITIWKDNEPQSVMEAWQCPALDAEIYKYGTEKMTIPLIVPTEPVPAAPPKSGKQKI